MKKNFLDIEVLKTPMTSMLSLAPTNLIVRPQLFLIATHLPGGLMFWKIANYLNKSRPHSF